MIKIFKFEAQDDSVYVQAVSQDAADDKVRAALAIPGHFPLIVSEVKALPEGEELLVS